MQAWDVTVHYDSVEEAYVKSEEFWDLLSHHKPLMGFNYVFTQLEAMGCAILDVTYSYVLRELTTRNILGWVYMVCPGMAVVCGTKTIDNIEALNK